MSLCTSADVSQCALRLEIIEEKSAHARTGDSGEASKPPRVDSRWTGFTPKSPRCSAACLALTATASDLGTDDHTHLIIICSPTHDMARASMKRAFPLRPPPPPE